MLYQLPLLYVEYLSNFYYDVLGNTLFTFNKAKTREARKEGRMEGSC